MDTYNGWPIELSKMTESEYTRGWLEADEAIKLKLPGCDDFSQGDSEWDRGWNARIELERGD